MALPQEGADWHAAGFGRAQRTAVGSVAPAWWREPSAHPRRVQHGPVRELRVDLHQQPAVRTVVDVLVRNIGQLDLRLYEEVDEAERQPKPDHPAALSLRYPSETVTSDKSDPVAVQGLSAVRQRVRAPESRHLGTQIGLFHLPAHMVEIRGASLFVAEGYRLQLRDGTYVDYTPDQILHWCGENPNDPRMGVSRLDTLRWCDRRGRRDADGDGRARELGAAGAGVGVPAARGAGLGERGPRGVRGGPHKPFGATEPQAGGDQRRAWSSGRSACLRRTRR